MSLYSILSALLDYPEAELIDALPDIEAAIVESPYEKACLMPLISALKTRSLIASQEIYVTTFDRNPAHALHLFEHVHGESRERGQAMVDLLDEYRRLGLDVSSNELPDYVPLFCEVLGLIDQDKAQALLDEAIHVLSAIGERLERIESPYAGVFAVLRALSSVQPRELVKPPVRDMDEALALFGTGPDGVEPLLTPSATQSIHFYPRGGAGANSASTAKEAG